MTFWPEFDVVFKEDDCHKSLLAEEAEVVGG